jgi:hypothetical protein
MARVERGVPLTGLLAVFGLVQLWGVVVGFLTWQRLVEHAKPYQGLALVGVIMGLLGIAALIGIWLWRRLAVYVLAALVVAGILLDVSLGLPSWALLIRLVLLAGLAWCIKEKWAAFR